MKMIKFKLSILFLMTMISYHGSAQSFSTVDIVKVKSVYEKEAMYFYNENWKAFRKEAYKKGFISGYQILRSATDSTNHFQLILITEYSDSTAFARQEDNFRPIMKSISPKGPKMLNDIPRKEILEYLSGYKTTNVEATRRESTKRKTGI